MVEAIVKFQEKIGRKAIRYFQEHGDVSFEEFHAFVNFKMGTEFHEHYVREFYNYFIEKRKEKNK